MEKYIVAAIIILIILGIVFIAYTVTTDKIIKGQEKEIAKLETENKRLRSALKELGKFVRY